MKLYECLRIVRALEIATADGQCENELDDTATDINQ